MTSSFAGVTWRVSEDLVGSFSLGKAIPRVKKIVVARQTRSVERRMIVWSVGDSCVRQDEEKSGASRCCTLIDARLVVGIEHQ